MFFRTILGSGSSLVSSGLVVLLWFFLMICHGSSSRSPLCGLVCGSDHIKVCPFLLQMPKLPLSPSCHHPFSLTRFPKTLLFLSNMSSPAKPSPQNTPQTLQNYPTPLSPPLPAVSKEIELARAMSASSKSSLFKLSRADVLYEDDWLIAVNKPQGIYCESVLASVPCLLNSNLANSGQLSEAAGDQPNIPELHLANRLDRDTSGVMVITKSHKVASKLVKAFTDHKVSKTYLALCIGLTPKWEKVTLKSGHGRSKFGAWRVYAASDVGRSLPGGSVVRNMETSFELLFVNGHGNFKEPTEAQKDPENTIVVEEKAMIDSDEKKDEILVRAYPRSGRTHQIRLHCQYLGMPIRGDVKYEGVYEWKEKTYDGHELHAESLSFEHPITGCSVLFRAPLPSWITNALDSL